MANLIDGIELELNFALSISRNLDFSVLQLHYIGVRWLYLINYVFAAFNKRNFLSEIYLWLCDSYGQSSVEAVCHIIAHLSFFLVRCIIWFFFLVRMRWGILVWFFIWVIWGAFLWAFLWTFARMTGAFRWNLISRLLRFLLGFFNCFLLFFFNIFFFHFGFRLFDSFFFLLLLRIFYGFFFSRLDCIFFLLIFDIILDLFICLYMRSSDLFIMRTVWRLFGAFGRLFGAFGWLFGAFGRFFGAFGLFRAVRFFVTRRFFWRGLLNYHRFLPSRFIFWWWWCWLFRNWFFRCRLWSRLCKSSRHSLRWFFAI